MLQFLAKRDNIDLNSVLNEMEMIKREQILSQHPYAITYSEKDNRYYSYLCDETKKNNRKKIGKKNLLDLENLIISQYNASIKVTFKSLYTEFMKYKEATVADTTVMAYIKAYKRFYKDDAIINIPLQDLTVLDLNKWLNGNIKKYNLSEKAYNKMAVVFRQLFDYATYKRIIEINPFEKITINKKLFKASVKKPDSEQVFLIDEQPLVESEAWKDFESKPCCVPLAILLAFQTGLRIGEVCVLKWSDIYDNNIRIRRFERPKQKASTDMTTLGKCSFEIVESVKGDFGERLVFLSDKAKKILNEVKKYNKEQGYDSDFIFINDKGHIHHRALDIRIRKYCKSIGICEKSMHKIRKTYISMLLDNQININTVRQLAGHKDERTTLQNYCYNRRSQTQIEEQLNEILCS